MTDKVYRLYSVYIAPQSRDGQGDGSALTAVRPNCVDADSSACVSLLGQAAQATAQPASAHGAEQ